MSRIIFMDFQYIYINTVNQHLFLAAGLGALIGLERELSGKDPSIRTFALISLGSCIFSMISIEAAQGIVSADPTRIAAQIVSGIGFIGAGTIFRSPKGVSGFTTAALMWVTAGIGMAVGFDRFDLGISTTVTAIAITVIFKLVHKAIRAVRKEPREHFGNDG